MTCHYSLVTAFEGLYRFRLRNLHTTLLARSPRVVVPELEHGPTEMLDDVAAIEINVFYERPAIIAVENHVFMLSRWTATLDDNAHGVRRTHWSMRDVWRDEERLSFADQMIDDVIAFADAHFDVALQLVEVFFRIDEMKIVPRVGTGDNHHEKIASVVEITIAYRRLELFPVLFDPVVQINWRLYGHDNNGVTTAD
jgi:hypothetical protein